MPNHDIPVHHLTVGSELYDACQSKQRASHYAVPVRRWNGRYFLYETELVRDTSSDKCRQYPLWNNDRKCQGCTQPKDYEYRDKMQAIEAKEREERRRMLELKELLR